MKFNIPSDYIDGGCVTLLEEKRINDRIKLWIVILFVLLALVFCLKIPFDQTTSDNLRMITTETDSAVRIDYVDSAGNLTSASDKGYATVIKELDSSGHSIKESYYDEQGTAVPGSSGQYALIREWTGDENTKITYLDASGQPTYNTSGYVSRLQEYDEYGQVIIEFFLGLSDEPVANRKGEYGRFFEYDSKGRKYKITSLDESGNPMINSSGYCSIIKTFNADDSVNRKIYCGVDGKPIQRGIYTVNDILKLYPWLTVLIGAVIVFAVVCLPQKAGTAIFAFYILFILCDTIILRESGSASLKLTPFWSYKQFFSNYTLRIEILNNIWLFVPFGAGLYSLVQKRQSACIRPWIMVILSSMIFSVIIEVSQYIFAIGFCETDDIISNTFGAIIGVMTAEIAKNNLKGLSNKTYI